LSLACAAEAAPMMSAAVRTVFNIFCSLHAVVCLCPRLFVPRLRA
jgi:hypothetical protein